MKIYITLLFLLPTILFAQNTDARVVSSYVIVTDNGSEVLNQYFENVRVETNRTFVQYNNLADYPTEKAKELTDGWIEKNKVYIYNGQKYLCLQSHLRTIYAPSETPALFATFRANATDTLVWVENEEVELGYVRTYNDVNYECIQAHMTLASWIPPNTPTLWKKITVGAECSPWVQPTGAHDAYNIGDCVTFNGQTYTSKINANVWSPTVYPAGWQLN